MTDPNWQVGLPEIVHSYYLPPSVDGKLLGWSAGTLINVNQLVPTPQDITATWCGNAGGSQNAILLTATPPIASYESGQMFRFIAMSTNTGAVTVSVSALAAVPVLSVGGLPLVGGEIVPGVMSIIYNGTSFEAQSILPFLQQGAGAVLRQNLSKMRDIISRDDYSSLAQMWAASQLKPKIDTSTGKAWFNTDNAPLDYSTSRAGFIVQHRDEAIIAANTLVPGSVFQFKFTGNGSVVAASELSTSIAMGLMATCAKTGDGSGHSFTAIGELGAYGAGGYNELGLFQGTGTNIGSALGTISGVEMYLTDSPDLGVTKYSTRMHPIVGRIAQHFNTVRESFCFFASSEGTLPVAGIMGVNNAGLKQWARGIDFSPAIFTSGQAALFPNNTSVAWSSADGTLTNPVMFVSATDDTYILPVRSTGAVNIANSSSALRLTVDSNATDAVLIFVNGAMKRIGVGVVNSGGAGFRQLIVPN